MATRGAGKVTPLSVRGPTLGNRPGCIGSLRFVGFLDDSALRWLRVAAQAVVAPTRWSGWPGVSISQTTAMIGRRIATQSSGSSGRHTVDGGTADGGRWPATPKPGWRAVCSMVGTPDIVADIARVGPSERRRWSRRRLPRQLTPVEGAHRLDPFGRLGVAVI
jgi:hypothetical protein